MDTEFDQRQEEFWDDHTNVRRYDHPVVRAFARQRVEFIAKLLRSWKPHSALDVGCGDGFGMQYMQCIAGSIHGCDQSRKMLDANPADDTHLKQCDAYQLTYEDAQFDLVYCWELLHHIGDPQKVVNEMARVAGKVVLICEPNSLNPAMELFGLLKPEEKGLRRFTPFYTRRLLINAGLKNISCDTVGWFTPNRTPEWLVRVLSKFPYRIPMLGLHNIALGFRV